MKYLFPFLSLFLFISEISAQSDVEDYIQQFNRMAVEEMHKFGIPASITLAQGILESGSGKSGLAVRSNNHFGIKCHTGWAGRKTYHDDDKKNECFRVYTEASESFRDHSLFLFHRSRYSFLFELERTDYKEWAKGLKKAGYATNPKYAHLLINLIERYNLHAYDLIEDMEMYAEMEKKKNADENEQELSEELANVGGPITDEVKPIISQHSGNVFLFNRIKTVISGPDDNLVSISQKHNIKIKRLKKYNELYDGEDLTPGMKVFLQPKRKKGPYRYHVVKPGESIREIAQMYGMKAGDLYEKNHMQANDQAAPSELLSLRKTNDNTPATISYEEFLRNKNEMIKQKERLEKKVVESPAPIVADKKERIIESPPQIDELVNNEKPSEVIEEVAELNEDGDEIIEAAADVAEEAIYTVQKGDTLYSIARWFKTSVENIKAWNNLESNALAIGQALIVGK
ncbi:MAG: LysM peptidoglycan-binding domain-containing protein [Chitinophagales bacterium]|nr:LysM peptidoglycan-binding domain-containing protein [Chitinophagales bacterium]